MLPLLLPAFVLGVQGLCGDSVRWSHDVQIEDVFGVWYGVGYTQHNPDLTNRPNEVGCVTLYITDDVGADWIDWSIPRGNYSDESWRSYKSNPWSGNTLAGSWFDIPLNRRRRQTERKVQVLWDEDGHTLRQTYTYYTEEPGFWTEDVVRPWEKLMMSRGLEVWYPDDPPRHPDVIKILKLTPHTLILNHCSEVGNGGIFSLILRRTPSRVQRWEWYQYQRQFNHFDLPRVYRQFAICSGNVRCCLNMVLYAVAILILYYCKIE
ncbi:uncharacterized protein LOC121729432 [Aricia agestis]|uniref:uncharacterized protein LOC121729432 n=1 Tax=Aricia agestis TaxID=91739 RepID=UPI001C203E41|nr:uncharacterized protein LOC121729432 [Aricia agestis]